MWKRSPEAGSTTRRGSSSRDGAAARVAALFQQWRREKEPAEEAPSLTTELLREG